VALYTGHPEMPGGLVKTLNPMIHAGILAVRGDPEHDAYLTSIGALPIDAVICNLYPFQEAIAKLDADFEDARGNIDIGGPTMLRAAAKNALGCVAVVDPSDYPVLMEELVENDGCTSHFTRMRLMYKVFEHTAAYDTAIQVYLRETGIGARLKCYDVVQTQGEL